jgi:glycosyltransferase involved in cell wall biosynthesis
VYVGGARWEDFGQAPLEALADGALVATVPSGGPFEALGLARELTPELVASAVDASALATALRAAFELPEQRVEDYRQNAARLLERFRGEAIARKVADEVVPALLR